MTRGICEVLATCECSMRHREPDDACSGSRPMLAMRSSVTVVPESWRIVSRNV